MEPQIFELQQKADKLADELKEASGKALTDKRAFTPEEKVELDSKHAEWKSLTETISRIERFAGAKSNSDRNITRYIDPLPHEDAKNVKHPYSMIKACRQLEGQEKGRDKLDGIELEVSQELQKRAAKPSQGAMVPDSLQPPAGYKLQGTRYVRMTLKERVERDNLLRRIEENRQFFKANGEQRAFDTTAATGAVETIWEDGWIQLYRNALLMDKLGVTQIDNLHGLFTMPRQNSASTTYWVAESGAPTGSNQTVDAITFTPHTIGAYVDITRRTFEQTSLDPELLVRQDLAMQLAIGVDVACLNAGGAPAPVGLLGQASIPTIALGANGASPTRVAIVQMEEDVAAANAEQYATRLCYATNAKGRSTLKQTLKSTGNYLNNPMIWEDGDVCNGREIYMSNQVPSNLTKGTSGAVCSAILYGNWANLIIASWTGMDLIRDPYTLDTSGGTRFVMLKDLDIQVRHIPAFAVIVDMLTT